MSAGHSVQEEQQAAE